MGFQTVDLILLYLIKKYTPKDEFDSPLSVSHLSKIYRAFIKEVGADNDFIKEQMGLTRNAVGIRIYRWKDKGLLTIDDGVMLTDEGKSVLARISGIFGDSHFDSVPTPRPRSAHLDKNNSSTHKDSNSDSLIKNECYEILDEFHMPLPENSKKALSEKIHRMFQDFAQKGTTNPDKIHKRILDMLIGAYHGRMENIRTREQKEELHKLEQELFEYFSSL